MVIGISHIETRAATSTPVIDGNSARITQLTVFCARLIGKLRFENTFGIELLHPVLVLHHKDVSLTVGIDTIGISELAVSSAVASPRAEEISCRVEFLYAMIEVVGDVQVVILIDGDTVGILELTVSRSVTAHGAQ